MQCKNLKDSSSSVVVCEFVIITANLSDHRLLNHHKISHTSIIGAVYLSFDTNQLPNFSVYYGKKDWELRMHLSAFQVSFTMWKKTLLRRIYKRIYRSYVLLIHIVDTSIRLLCYSDNQACSVSRLPVSFYCPDSYQSSGEYFPPVLLEKVWSDTCFCWIATFWLCFSSWVFTLFHVSIFLLSPEILLVSTVSLLSIFLLPLSCKVLACIVSYSSTFFLVNAKPRSHCWAATKCIDKSHK